MQLFPALLAQVRAVSHANPNTFDPANRNNSAMKKITFNSGYVKKHITHFMFIVLVTTVTILKRMMGGKVIRIRH
jgi:hypothetical protein